MTTARRAMGVRLLAAAVALTVFAVGVYVALDRDDSGTTPSAAVIGGSHSGTDSSVVATAKGDKLHVFAAEGDEQPSRSVTAPRPFVPLVTLVLDRDGDWLHVLLPARPNGSTGWVRSDDVTQSIVTYRVTVSLSDHRLVVRDGDSLVLETSVAVGKAETPTPPGLFFITELLSVPDSTGPYGPFAYGLSGHSPVLTDFANGDGQLGLHGTNQPELLGSDATHGRIRLSNDDIGKLASELPLGTPINVVA